MFMIKFSFRPFKWIGRSKIAAPPKIVVSCKAGANELFSGSTSSFPAIKRGVRLADDSNSQNL